MSEIRTTRSPEPPEEANDTRSRIYRRIWLELLWRPAVLLPGTAGGLALLVGMIVPGGRRLLLPALIGLLFAGSMALVRWLVQHEEILDRASRAAEREAARDRERELDRLALRLKADKFSRGPRLLERLRSLREGLRESAEWRGRVDRDTARDLDEKVERLFQGCIAGLERSLELNARARKLANADAGSPLLQAREKVLAEVEASVEGLRRIAEEVQAIALRRIEEEGEELSRARAELEQSLDLARRVEERVSSLDVELDPPRAAASRSGVERA